MTTKVVICRTRSKHDSHMRNLSILYTVRYTIKRRYPHKLPRYHCYSIFFLWTSKKKAPCYQCVIRMKRIKAYFYTNFTFSKHLECDPKVSPLKKNLPRDFCQTLPICCLSCSNVNFEIKKDRSQFSFRSCIT